MKTIYIRPRKGFKIRDMSGAVVPSYGIPVERHSFWVRKLNDKDVEEITEADFSKGKKDFDKATEAQAKKAQDNPPAAGT